LASTCMKLVQYAHMDLIFPNESKAYILICCRSSINYMFLAKWEDQKLSDTNLLFIETTSRTKNQLLWCFSANFSGQGKCLPRGAWWNKIRHRTRIVIRSDWFSLNASGCLRKQSSFLPFYSIVVNLSEADHHRFAWQHCRQLIFYAQFCIWSFHIDIMDIVKQGTWSEYIEHCLILIFVLLSNSVFYPCALTDFV
jgi:hypothetical protein